MLPVYLAITPRGIYINYQFLHMGFVVYNMLTDYCPSVRSACYTPHNTCNIVVVTGLVSRYPKSEWSFGVQMKNCLKFDNDDLEQNKQGVIVKILASDTQSCMQGQSYQCLREFNHKKRTMDTIFLNDPLLENT